MVEMYPQNYYGYMLRGFIYSEKRNYQAAILDYTKAIEIIKKVKDKDKTQFNDNNAWLHLYRGKAYMQLDECENAINDYNVCITEHLERIYPEVYILRGGTYAQMGDKENAKKDLVKFKELTVHKG